MGGSVGGGRAVVGGVDSMSIVESVVLVVPDVDMGVIMEDPLLPFSGVYKQQTDAETRRYAMDCTIEKCDLPQQRSDEIQNQPTVALYDLSSRRRK